jgi:hypothetical protein
MDQAALQSAYDGAALVHSRNEALAYMGQADPASHASVLTVTTDGRAVNVFGHYAAPSAGRDKLKYHQYRLSSAHMDESYHDFKKGRKQLRNAQDFAKEQSNHLRDQLQEYWKTHHHLAPACHTWSPPAAPHLPAADGGALPPWEVPGPSVPDPTEEEGAGYEIVEPGDHSAPHALSNPGPRGRAEYDALASLFEFNQYLIERSQAQSNITLPAAVTQGAQGAAGLRLRIPPAVASKSHTSGEELHGARGLE